MKTLLIALGVSSSAAMAAEPIAPFAFDARLGDIPLKFSDSMRIPPLSFASPGQTPGNIWMPGRPSTTVPAPKFMSRMPIVAPKGDVDPHMPIKKPDPSIDHKLIVKGVEMVPAK